MNTGQQTPIPKAFSHEQQDECPICFEETQDFMVLHPLTNNVRHEVCLTCWNGMQNVEHCPFCRHEYRNNVAILPSPRSVQNVVVANVDDNEDDNSSVNESPRARRRFRPLVGCLQPVILNFDDDGETVCNEDEDESMTDCDQEEALSPCFEFPPLMNENDRHTDFHQPLEAHELVDYDESDLEEDDPESPLPDDNNNFGYDNDNNDTTFPKTL